MQPGDHVQSFMAIDLNGRLVTIGYPDEAKKTVLLVFSTECAVCEKNIAFWNDLFKRADSYRYRIIGIAKNDPVELKLFAESMNLKFPILMSDELSFWWYYKLFRLPQTILINEQGAVEYVWPGVLAKSVQAKIQKLIIH
ncbi:MAG TPA: TlpA disulfide reductase family protein [bacterium]